MNITCQIQAFTDGTYGKSSEDGVDTRIIMEYAPFLSIMPNFLPTNSTNTGFNNYLTSNPSILFDFADMLYYTLPEPRYSYYQSNDYDTM
jgi:hypothetical protein